jgi:pimeloyl-ACP methyl ester carboxylesterase
MYYMLICLCCGIPFLFLFATYITKFLYSITSKYYYISKNNLFTEIEDAIFADYNESLHIFSKYTTVNIEGEDWLAHTIIVKEKAQSVNKPNLLILHGTSSGALVWQKCWNVLAKKFNLYCLSVPGFGRTKSPKSLRTMNPAISDKLLCEFVVKYLEKEHLDGDNIPYILGHSFGAHIALLFSFYHKDLVRALILVSPAGIFPTSGTLGAYWGLYFKTSIIQILLRQLGGFAKWIAFTWFDYFQVSIQYYYWFTMLSCVDQIGDSVVSSHITVNWNGSNYWNNPTISMLLELKCPVSFIYGEYDIIIPAHQGLMLLRLMDSDSRCFIIPTGHSALDAPSEFGNAVLLAAKYVVQNGSNAITFSKYLHNKNWKIYSSSLNIKYTNRTIQKLYHFLDMSGCKHGKFIHILYTNYVRRPPEPELMFTV